MVKPSCALNVWFKITISKSGLAIALSSSWNARGDERRQTRWCASLRNEISSSWNRRNGQSQGGIVFVGPLHCGNDNDGAREGSRSEVFRKRATWACDVFGKMSRRRYSATWGVLRTRDRLSRASPTFAAASQIFLQSPDTNASIAARTFLLIRFGGPTSAGTGWSRAASAHFAGIGGVMFSMGRTIGAWPRSRNAPKRHVFVSGRRPLHDSRKPAGELGIRRSGADARSAIGRTRAGVEARGPVTHGATYPGAVYLGSDILSRINVQMGAIAIE
jgi:hypothetical protein